MEIFINIKIMQQECSQVHAIHHSHKKPRLSIQQVAFIPINMKSPQSTKKTKMKRNQSDIDLKAVLFEAINKDSHKSSLKQKDSLNPEFQSLLRRISRQGSYANSSCEQLSQNFIAKESQKQSIPKFLPENPQSKQKQKLNNFLPSIIKKIVQEETIFKERANKKELVKDEQTKKYISLQFEVREEIKRKQKLPTFRKMKSQNLTHLQNKLKLQKFLNEDKHNLKMTRNTNKNFFQSPEEKPSQNAMTTQKKKKFYINNLNLDTLDNLNEPLTKRNYMIKLIQNHEHEIMAKPENRKNSYQNILKKQPKLSPKKSPTDQNLISRKIVLALPQEIMLKKLEGVVKNEEKQRKQEKHSTLEAGKRQKGLKHRRDRLIGWDYEKQPQSNLLNLDNNFFDSIS